MARIRSIKPEFWSHPVLARQEDAVHKMGASLLNFADDEGYFFADPAKVRSENRPFDEDSTITRRCIAILTEVGYIEVSTHPTHGAIGRVVNFTKHQVIDRPKASKIRPYFVGNESEIARRSVGDESLLEQGTGNRERNREQGSKKASSPIQPLSDHEIEDGVTRILKLYPVIVGKDRTEKAIMQAIQAEKVDLGTEAEAIAYLEALTAKYARIVEPFRNDRRMWEQVPRPWNWFGKGYYKAESTWIPVGAFDNEKNRPQDVAITAPSTTTWDEMDDTTKAALADVAWRQGDKKLDRVPEHMRPYVKAAGGAA